MEASKGASAVLNWLLSLLASLLQKRRISCTSKSNDFQYLIGKLNLLQIPSLQMFGLAHQSGKKPSGMRGMVYKGRGRRA